jgi:hypothetical protein
MAELHLAQDTVANALSLHPSNLSRRLRGGVQDPPAEPMLQALLHVLQLEGERAERWAGFPLGWVDVAGTVAELSGPGPDRLWLVEHQAGYYWPSSRSSWKAPRAILP